MKPLDSTKTNQEGCDPISSNCVIWQGPDIPCIQLCKGDSISDVTAKIAQELCDLLDQLDIDTFDLTCFNPICPTPENIHDLLQFIIDKLCTLNDCCDQSPAPIGGCPDCIVDIAACFYYQNQLGDTITTMQLSDYVHAIGNKICLLVSQIDIINQTLADHETRITNIEENCCTGPGGAPAPGDGGSGIPNFTSSCLISPVPPAGIPIQDLVATLEAAFCELRSATGLPNDILLAILKQCANLDLSPSLGQPGVNMGSLSGWITQGNYTDLSDAVNNMWLTICDLRAAVANIQANCCPSGCDGLVINMSVVLSGSSLLFYFTGTAPAGFQDCAPAGNLVTITDADGAVFITHVPVIPYLNGVAYQVQIGSTPLNPALNFSIHMDGCWENTSTNTTCERCLDFNLINSNSCPAVTITPAETSISWSFSNVIATPVSYIIELYNAAGDTLIDSETVISPPVGIVSGSFSGAGVVGGTTYKIRVGITINSVTTYCPFGVTTTLPDSCPAPTNVSAIGVAVIIG